MNQACLATIHTQIVNYTLSWHLSSLLAYWNVVHSYMGCFICSLLPIDLWLNQKVKLDYMVGYVYKGITYWLHAISTMELGLKFSQKHLLARPRYNYQVTLAQSTKY